MIGTDEIIDLDMLPEAQAASITTLSGPVTQYQLDMTAPIDDGEAFIQASMMRSLKTLWKLKSMRPPKGPQNTNA